MARRTSARAPSRARSGVDRAAARVGRTVTDVASLPQRLDDRLRPLATALGWAGTAALAACAVLHFLPDDAWPDGLSRAQLPVYATWALVTASLLGWSFMQEGQKRIERQSGRTLGLALFVFLPLIAAAVTLADEHLPLRPEVRADWNTLFVAARWYSPAAVVASLAAFLSSKSRRAARLAGHSLLLAPYAVLLAALVFGFRFPWIDEPLHETLEALGGGAVALQIVLAWFVGAAG